MPAALARAHGSDGHVLSHSKLVGFVAKGKPAEARSFYREILGLSLVEEGPFALAFDANGTTLRVQKVEAVSPTPYTALGWQVEDIRGGGRGAGGAGCDLPAPRRAPSGRAGDPALARRVPGGMAHGSDGNTPSLTERREASWPGSA